MANTLNLSGVLGGSVLTISYFPQGNLSIIINELETAMRERIASREWLDEPTRQRALSKLNSIHELVAYPERIRSNDFLNDYYAGVRTMDINAGTVKD
jgi:predicted metalloendopeptidase